MHLFSPLFVGYLPNSTFALALRSIFPWIAVICIMPVLSVTPSVFCLAATGYEILPVCPIL
jgi:hypothetical protein